MQKPAGEAGPAVADKIAAAVHGFSLEATFPNQSEIGALKLAVPTGTRIYLSCPPNHSSDRLVEFAAAVRGAGFEPVPHLTARVYQDRASLDRVLSCLVAEASVRSALVIAGDRDDAAGPFAGALDLIESGALEGHGIREIDISGYPDGHPKLDDAVLRRALAQKLAAGTASGLSISITTQFCFEPDAILAWLRGLRAAGVTQAVRIGVAGPTSMRALMRFALRCGVRASLKGALNPKAMQLFGEAAPDAIIRALAEAPDHASLAPFNVHFFSFGGLITTGEWAAAAAGGRIEPHAHGFRIVR